MSAWEASTLEAHHIHVLSHIFEPLMKRRLRSHIFRTDSGHCTRKVKKGWSWNLRLASTIHTLSVGDNESAESE